VIDTLVEMDLANGCGGRDLVYLLAWRSLMLLVHNETFLEAKFHCGLTTSRSAMLEGKLDPFHRTH